MYVLLFGILFGSGIWMVMSGLASGARSRIWLGGLIGTSGIALIMLMTFWAELLWYDALGYEARFWTFVWARVGTVVVGVSAAAGARLAATAVRRIARGRDRVPMCAGRL